MVEWYGRLVMLLFAIYNPNPYDRPTSVKAVQRRYKCAAVNVYKTTFLTILGLFSIVAMPPVLSPCLSGPHYPW